MNYLAHLFLSANTPAGVIGNLAVDFLKGQGGYRHDGIAEGMARHRRIDQLTDTHPAFRASCGRIGEPHGRYAGVIVDLFYDHLLAIHWERYAGQTLDVFSAWAYGLLQAHQAWLPPRLQRALPYMVAENWLSQYRHVDGIRRALGGLSRRARRPIELQLHLADLDAHFAAFEADFHTFFPAMMAAIGELPGDLCGPLPASRLTRACLPAPEPGQSPA